MISRHFAPDLFKGRTVFVTGGGGTINAGIAQGFAELGANVALSGRTVSRLEQAAAAMRGHGGEIVAVPADVQEIRDSRCRARHQRAADRQGRRAGLRGRRQLPGAGRADDAPTASARSSRPTCWARSTPRARPFAQLKATRGNIIFVSATNSIMPFAFQAHVGAAKAGVDSLMRGLALEWGKYGIRCNSVLPGPIEKTEGLRRLLTEEDIAELRTYVPLGRFGTIEDVAGVCCFLASPLASLLTGVSLVADGGQSFSGSAMLAELMMNP